MNIVEEVIDDIIVEIVNLDRATLSEADELRNNVTEKINAGYNKMIIDLTSVEYLDSTFLGVIVNTLKKVAKMGGDLKLVGFKPAVRSMFELTRLFRVFESYSELQDALKSFHK
ncbi:MAG: anti-anti-sigma factor [Ignavibacteriae bacterium HGW-Ignavibacteriae-3]|nr:MAG: anti-anti-sigma factor [Ignavibacteriae bacterium HGW-Ignavibacteriae-3]